MPAAELDRGEIIARNIGVGCITTVSGFFSGGMIAVLVAKFVEACGAVSPSRGYRPAIGGCMLVSERLLERSRCLFLHCGA